MFPPWSSYPRDTAADWFAIAAGNDIRMPQHVYMTNARGVGSTAEMEAPLDSSDSEGHHVEPGPGRSAMRRGTDMRDDVDAGARSNPAVDEAPAAGAPPASDMIRIPGGEFLMGSDHHYPEEAPVHRVRVDAFWMDRTPVTASFGASLRRRTT
jgi:formylglycine-generating enzyme required for sulfatase activity